MTQFADNEDLSKNSLLEIDFDEMTRSHLTGAYQSCPGLSVCLSVCLSVRHIVSIGLQSSRGFAPSSHSPVSQIILTVDSLSFGTGRLAPRTMHLKAGVAHFPGG